MDVNYSSGDSSIDKPDVMPLNSAQATSLIVERANKLVNQLVERRGHDRPPFLPAEFSRLVGIKGVVEANLGETSAVLLRFHDGYLIKVNQNHYPARRNFSCAHEIGHILFSELNLEPYIQSIEYRTYNPAGERKTRSTARERLCDVAAAELLMPESVFRKYLSGFGISVYSIERLASVFKVSIPAVAMRIAEISLEPCFALLWQARPRNKSKGLQLAWRVGPGRNSRGKANYIPVDTLVEPDSSLYKAFQGDNVVKSWKAFKINNDKKRLAMESKGFGYGETRYVISLVSI